MGRAAAWARADSPTLGKVVLRVVYDSGIEVDEGGKLFCVTIFCPFSSTYILPQRVIAPL